MNDVRRELREITDQNFRKVMDRQKQIWRYQMRQKMHEEMVNYLVFRNVPEEYRKPLYGIRQVKR